MLISCRKLIMQNLCSTTPIRGLLLDISGVLYNSGEGDGEAIEGSVDAVSRLQSSDLALRFVSNETSNTRQGLVEKLRRLGFEIRVDQVFTPAPAVVQILKERQLRPHLLMLPQLRPEFESVDQTHPNCVVMGDAAQEFSYSNMITAFQLLMHLENPILISMGYGKYYMETDGLKLDVGAYAKALEYACDLEAEIVGKPSRAFFHAAVHSMGVGANEVFMIGDDIVSDIGGAQKCGIRAVQVRTGKWRPSWENHPDIIPDAIVDNLAEAADVILRVRKT